MEIYEEKDKIVVQLSSDELHIIYAALHEIPEAVDESDCATRTGYELREFDNLKQKIRQFWASQQNRQSDHS